MMLDIRLAKEEEFENVKAFYHDLIDMMEEYPYGPKWKKNVYPTNDFLLKSIKNHELYIGALDASILSCMVLNQECNEGYKKIQWSLHANDNEIYVIHILGVHPIASGNGIAKAMVHKAIEIAKANHIKVIRLDVLKGNVPAEKTYSSVGFQYMDTISMFYEDTGWTDFKLYEFIV